jgi:hypothetical protein
MIYTYVFISEIHVQHGTVCACHSHVGHQVRAAANGGICRLEAGDSSAQGGQPYPCSWAAGNIPFPVPALGKQLGRQHQNGHLGFLTGFVLAAPPRF